MSEAHDRVSYRETGGEDMAKLGNFATWKSGVYLYGVLEFQSRIVGNKFGRRNICFDNTSTPVEMFYQLKVEKNDMLNSNMLYR